MKRGLLISGLAGLAAGLVILGVGGRILMRILAFTTPEDPRFTWFGTVQIVSVAAAWGLLTGPLIALASANLRSSVLAGSVYGLVVFLLAAVPFFLYSGFGGTLVAPSTFLWLGAITFPLLFATYGIVVTMLWELFRPAA